MLTDNLCLYCKKEIIPFHRMGRWEHDRVCEKKKIHDIKKIVENILKEEKI